MRNREKGEHIFLADRDSFLSVKLKSVTYVTPMFTRDIYIAVNREERLKHFNEEKK